MKTKGFLYRLIQLLFALSIFFSVFLSLGVFSEVAPHTRSRLEYQKWRGYITIEERVGSTYGQAVGAAMITLGLSFGIVLLLRETALYLFFGKKFFQPLPKVLKE